MAHQTKHRQRGAGYIEVLVSSLILSLSLLAALSLYGFSMNMIDKTGDQGYAYNIARKWLEDARQKGFKYQNLPEGSLTKYYNSKGLDQSNTTTDGSDSNFSGARFKMVRTVTSDKFTVESGGGTHPSDTALRTVVVTVTYVSSGEIVEQSWTHLVRSGV